MLIFELFFFLLYLMLDLDNVIDYVKGKKQVSEEQPFGPDNLVYKVCGKMFMLVSLDSVPHSVNLKCEPNLAIELREKYSFVLPGYHMNKVHWNTIVFENGLDYKFLFNQIDNSYDLVVNGLSKKLKVELLNGND